MRAIHLNYHEFTRDPRVMKECIALANKGVEVQVICTLEDSIEASKDVENIPIARIDWMSPFALSKAYLHGLKEFSHSFPHVYPRLETQLKRVEVSELLTKRLGYDPYVGNQFGFFHMRGWKRWREKRRLKRALGQVMSELFSPDPQDDAFFDTGLDRYSVEKEIYLNSAYYEKQNAIYTDLYQACAFLFDANVQNLDLTAPVDIVHAHDIYTLPAGVRLARATNAKLIYDAHEYEIGRATKMPLEGNAIAEAIEQDCLTHVDALITVSQGISDLYAERFKKRLPILVMNAPDVSVTALDEASAKEERGQFRKAIGVTQETPLISYTGWVHQEQRGLSHVVWALLDLPEFHLVLLGPRQESDDQALMGLAAEIGVEGRVHLLEPVHNSLVVPTIRNCDVAVVPIQDSSLSYRHSMPNKLFEAVFAGLPVCVSDLPDMRAFVESLGRGQATDATDPKAIARTLSSLYQNRADYALEPDQYAELVRLHSWSAQAETLYSLYLELSQDHDQMSDKAG